MFKRIILEDWMHIFPRIGFVVLFAVFLLVIVRVIFFTKKKRLDHMSSLPLEKEKIAHEKPKRP